MKKTMVVLMTVMMTAGFNWSLPQETAVANQTSPKGSDVSFMTSVTTLNYQGQKAQNRVQTASLAKIKRQITSTGAMYTLSGEGGLRIGKDGQASFYKVSPVMVNRNSVDRLSSAQKGLEPWLTVINDTLNGLTHKHMVSEAWEEPIVLSLGNVFPQTIQVRFRARPLPEPDSKWTLITADSGLISFRALDEKYQDTLIYGRYRGVLVYSPEADAFLQSAAAFNLYHGEDQFRIEQMHFAADANGKQLQPVLNVGPYLDFKPEAPPIATPGQFPSWCVQAAQFLDILHLAIMTAAEGSTNRVPIDMVDQSLSNILNHDYPGMEKVLGRAAADAWVGEYMKIFDFWNDLRKKGLAKATYNLGKSLGKDFIIDALPFGIGNIYKLIELDFTVAKAVEDQMDYDLNKVMKAPFSQPARPVLTKPAPPVQIKQPPPPTTQIKQPKKGSGIIGLGTISDILIGAGLLSGIGAYIGLKPGGNGGGDDCAPYHGEECVSYSFPGPTSVYILIPVGCDCPSGTEGGNSYEDQETYDGITYNRCFCTKWIFK